MNKIVFWCDECYLRNDGTGRNGKPSLAAVREDFYEHFSISARLYCLRYIFVGYAERAMFPTKSKKSILQLNFKLNSSSVNYFSVYIFMHYPV